MFEELKEIIFIKLKESMMTENTNRDRNCKKKNQIEILELKSVITETNIHTMGPTANLS